MTPAIEYYLELNRKNCVALPEFALIQDYTLSLNGVYINSSTIHALANYIIAQTRMQALLTTPGSEGVCSPSQIFVKHLIIDDCGMKDVDFAVLLGAISLQGKLKSLTYANCEFGWKSLTALCAVLSESTPTGAPESLAGHAFGSSGAAPASTTHTKKEHLECLRLTNLKTEQHVLLRLFAELDGLVDVSPITKLKLSCLDLNHIHVLDYLNKQLAAN